MTDITSPEIAIRSTSWRFNTEQVEIPYTTIGEQPDSLLLTGLGERDVVSIAERLAANGITGLAVASLVYPKVSGRLENQLEVVESSIVEGTAALARDIRGDEQPLRLIVGVSRGGSQAFLGMFKNPNLAQKAVAVAPGCLNNEALIDEEVDIEALSDRKRLTHQVRGLLKRFESANMSEVQQGMDISDVEKLELMGELRGEMAYAATLGDVRAVVDAVQDKATIYIGDEEEIFPYSEAVAGVGEDNIILAQGLRHPVPSTETGAAAFAAFLLDYRILEP